MPIQTTSESALWVSEHGWILSGRQNRCLDGGNLELNREDFQSLETLLEDSLQDSEREALPLSYCLRHGCPAFKVQNQVGLIRTGTGQQIEILPKLSRLDSAEHSRQVLLQMLMTLQDSPFSEAVAADLDVHRMPLFELLLRYYLDQVATLVRRGIARSYVRREGNLSQLRGRILIRENIRHNVANAAHFYCEYEEFIADRPINRLIKSGLRITACLTRLPRSQQLCRELLDWFEEVDSPRDWRLEFRRIRWDRNVHHYRKAMPACRMLHEQLNPLTRQGSNRAIAMLFPMEQVFEDYAGDCLRRQFPTCRLELQKQGRYLVDEHAGRPIFALRPDFVLNLPDKVVIADAKWKMIDSGDRANKYGISQADMYQLYAYAKRILASAGPAEVWLVYPAHDRFRRPLPDFEFEVGGSRLRVLPLELLSRELVVSS